MNYTLTIFSIPICHYCNNLKKRLTDLNIPFINFDVIEFREEWLLIVEHIGIDIIPTCLIKDDEHNEGKFFIPGIDYKTEDEIVEIIKEYFKNE